MKETTHFNGLYDDTEFQLPNFILRSFYICLQYDGRHDFNTYLPKAIPSFLQGFLGKRFFCETGCNSLPIYWFLNRECSEL